MLLKKFIPFLLLLSCICVGLSNKNGRASQAGAGNTGAPGDEALPNGAPITCGTECHVGTPSSSSLTLIDSTGQSVTKYMPGKKYKARLVISSNITQGYGFQMIALKDSDNSDLKLFTDNGANNYKLATAFSNGRRYAEHDNISNSNTFEVEWTAPSSGTGTVTFYAAGNAVDRSSDNTGDEASVATPLKIIELSSETWSPNASEASLRAFPNPINKQLQLSAEFATSEICLISIFDTDGKLIQKEQVQAQAGKNVFQLDAANWSAGVYLVHIRGAETKLSVKVSKL